MRPSKYSIVTAIWCISALFFNLHAKRQVEALLLNSDTKLPISNATVLCIESGTSTITNNEGHFKLHIIDSLFESTCKIQCLGYQNKELSISKFPDRDTVLFLDPISLQLKEIEVTATSNKREYTANSQIYKSALNHIQPYDLGDALTLLPGIEITTNDNTKARQGYLRTPVSNYESLITAMGTAIVIDGSPISNNSNLQVSNSANFGIGGHFETTSGQGNDLRQITVNNIQQIEVIRGIAPVNYGDITSGVINIKREVGVQHQTLLFQMDPNYFKFYTSRGFSLGKKHIFNADIDYKNSTSDLRIPVPNYQQFASRFAHQYLSTNQLWKNNLSIDLGYSYDVNKKDKNDLFLEKSDNEEQWMRINNRGELSFRNQQNTKVKYHFSWQEKRQYSYNSDLISSNQLISTTIKDDSEYECSLLPSRYYSAMTIDGKPMMLYSQLEILQTKQLLHQTHLFSFGSEYRYEKNNGEGRTFRNDAGYHAAYNQRDRAYSSIPSTATLTLYAQDKITIPLGDNRLILNMGVRYDNYNPTSVTKGSDGQIIQPRINLGFDIGKNISFFAGYGISSKLAPLIFRSPDNAYIDVVSFVNISAKNPSENLLIATTKVIPTKNHDITFSKMRKYETGAQIKLPLVTIDYSIFYEHQTDIPSFTSTITPFSYNSYEIFFYNAGSKPTLDHINVDKLIARQTYLAPTNDKELIRKGVDFTLATKKTWANNGPKFILSGAYFNTIINNSNLKYDISSQERSENKDKLIGIYQSEGHDTDYFLTSLTCTQHIPSLKFIASLTIQNRWINKIVYRKLSTLPIGYMNNLGETYWFTPTDDIKNKFSYLIRDYSTISSNSTEKPSFTNVTLRLTKEISKSLVFSFYINNFFMHNPAWINRQDLRVSKGNPELYFSGEIKIKL